VEFVTFRVNGVACGPHLFVCPFLPSNIKRAENRIQAIPFLYLENPSLRGKPN